MLTEVNKKLFTLQKLKGVGPSTLKKLFSMSNFADVSVSDLASFDQKLAKALGVSNAWDNALDSVEKDIENCEKHGIKIVTLLDEDYPVLLKNTFDCPIFLYLKGQWSKEAERCVAVIGTRSPTEHGAIIAKRTTGYLVEQRWSIVSGLAIGCDALAHQVAIENGGHTVAVLAHGLHTIAPKQHERLASKILDSGGALVSEYAFGVEPIPPFFVKRDRIQAGLSQGVVMIQSDLTGGSMHASRAAIEYGRCLAVPVATDRDFAFKEKKIEANLVLTGGSQEEKMTLLKCGAEELRNIFVISSKNDYSDLSRRLDG